MEPALKPSRMMPAPWQARGGAVALEVRSLLDGVDALAVEMERKWGVGRLRLLVDDILRTKFDRQRLLLNKAIFDGDLEDIRREAPRMANAWRALDAAAAGASLLSPRVLETTLGDGTLIVIVRDKIEAHAVTGDGRKAQVWTLEEIARLIEAFPAVVKTKQTVPGAEVVATRMPVDPVDDFDDEIPF